MAKKKCSCDIPKLAGGVLAIAIGLYLIVLGWATQGLGQTYWSVLWYFLGVFSMTLGKIMRDRAIVCPIH